MGFNNRKEGNSKTRSLFVGSYGKTIRYGSGNSHIIGIDKIMVPP